MEKMKIRELMRPVEEFPSISSQATFMEAVEALEKAQDAYQSGKASHTILMVFDGPDRILGKLSPMDVVQGLEPKYDKVDSLAYSRFHISRATIDRMKEELRLWQRPLGDLCRKAYEVKVGDFIRAPSPERMVDVDDSMDQAFHLFVLGRPDSLFVTEKGKIVGLIRFSDVYTKIVEVIKKCDLTG